MKFVTVLSILLAAHVSATTPETSAAVSLSSLASDCKTACAQLEKILPGRVAQPRSVNYIKGNQGYWSSLQSGQNPACRVTPAKAQDISQILPLLRQTNCQFAVKSGGHSSFAGASNIDNGVTIDLSSIRDMVVSVDRKLVSIGAGRVWTDVYSELDQLNLTVIGGRSGGIGVSGLILGGGISFFSGRYGWACDNIINYEVVFADGCIHNVNEQSFPDLYFALRGGGNNFGIVTRVDVLSFDQGKMLGGQTFYTVDKMPALNKALYHFTNNHEQDPDGAVILSYGFAEVYGAFLASGELEYAKPERNPPILANFTKVTPLLSTVRITNLTDLNQELMAAEPAGRPETMWAFTVRNDEQLINDLQVLFNKQALAIIDILGIVVALIFQPISTAMSKHFTVRGGNALGIQESDGPLLLVSLAIGWTSELYNDRIQAFASKYVKSAVALSKERNLDHRYIYQNYAGQPQDVFTGYGEENKARLKSIHRKYDPTGVFTKLQPGYFKIE